MDKTAISTRLDWNRMLGFEQIAAERRALHGKLGSKVGVKLGVKVGGKIGVKIGSKTGIKA
jgi:hypothetical protein